MLNSEKTLCRLNHRRPIGLANLARPAVSDDFQRDDQGRPRPSSSLGQLLDQAIFRYESAPATGRWWLAWRHWKIKTALERLIFGNHHGR